MKVSILGDTHWGIRNGSELYFNYFMKFIEDDFLPHLKRSGIKTVIQTGDFFDKRKGIDYRTLTRVKEEFLEPLREAGVSLHVFPGNHDIYFRHTNEINSVTELISHYENVNVYNDPTTVQIGSNNVDFIPWINPNNKEQIAEFIASSDSRYCVGHFEIDSFEMQKGIEGHGGMSVSSFANYDRVISGHYHTRSSRKNINYVGTPYEMTWADFSDKKGFHDLDLEKDVLTFYENKHTLYHKLFYSTEINLETFDFEKLSNSIVKIIVKERSDLFHYERFLDNVEKSKPYDFSIVESDVIIADGVDEAEFEALDTFEVLKTKVEEAAEAQGIDVGIMMKHLHELHAEAVTLEAV